MTPHPEVDVDARVSLTELGERIADLLARRAKRQEARVAAAAAATAPPPEPRS